MFVGFSILKNAEHITRILYENPVYKYLLTDDRKVYMTNNNNRSLCKEEIYEVELEDHIEYIDRRDVIKQSNSVFSLCDIAIIESPTSRRTIIDFGNNGFTLDEKVKALQEECNYIKAGRIKGFLTNGSNVSPDNEIFEVEFGNNNKNGLILL